MDHRARLRRYERRAFIKAAGYVCAYCGTYGGFDTADGLPWNTDHVVPLSRGGEPGASNMVLACERCNTAKGDHQLAELRDVLLGMRDRQLPRAWERIGMRDHVERMLDHVDHWPKVAA